MEAYTLKLFLNESNYTQLSDNVYTYRPPSGIQKCIRCYIISTRVNTSSSYRTIYMKSNLVRHIRYQPQISFNSSNNLYSNVVTSLSHENFSSTDNFISRRVVQLELSNVGTNLNQITISFSNDFSTNIAVSEFSVDLELVLVEE